MNLDFGLLDPDGDPDRHQNLITWSLGHALPLQEISSKSVHNFCSYPTDRQTDRQTDRSENITSFGAGNQSVNIHRESKKNMPPNFRLYLHQILMDFKNSFTGTLCGKFAVMLLLNTPPHLYCVATLPCEI